MGRPVTVQFLKYPDLLHWGFESVHLGEDEHGVWLAVPAGSRRWRGDSGTTPTRLDAVFCAPREEWWHLHYGGPGAFKYTMFIDIVTPPKWIGSDRYEMVDLDLDVVVHPDGMIEVEDEDEFEEHQVKYSYSEEMISRALSETQRVVELLEEKKEPFFDVAESWLKKV